MLRTQRPPLVALVLLVGIGPLAAACDSGTDVDLREGEDAFSSNTLSSYTPVSRDGSSAVWSVENGWLVGRSDGQAINAGLIRRDVVMADGRLAFESDHMTNGGIRFRVQDSDSYYLLAVRDNDASYSSMWYRNFELYLFDDGVWTSLAEYDLDIPRGTRFTAAVEFVGPTFALYLNGALVGSVQESTLPGPGQVGLEHDDRLTPGEESRYDVFRWESLD